MSFDPEKSPYKKDDLPLTTISIRPIDSDNGHDDADSLHHRPSSIRQTRIVREDDAEIDEAAKIAKDKTVYSAEFNERLVRKIDKRIVVFAGGSSPHRYVCEQSQSTDT